MSIKINEEIGLETHLENDQFFRIEDGIGKCVINNQEYVLENGVGFVVPAGTPHNIINTSKEKALKLYTIYSPPHHKDGTINEIKPIKWL